jgi:hypothetical protein
MLSTMARELVERNGIGEAAGAVWKALNAEHQKLFPTISRSTGRAPSGEMPVVLTGAQTDPACLVQTAINNQSVVAFGQPAGALSGRRRRGRVAAPEQLSLFSFN